MSLNWDLFNQLEGDSRNNFENLWHQAVYLNYSAYGSVRHLKNQPGVEFHLKLERDCFPQLGEAGRHWGWQCKYFQEVTEKGKKLTPTQKKQITDSLEATVKHVLGITDWVLCTPQVLSKSDQSWFYGLKTQYPKYTLHLASSTELEALLIGKAQYLKHTFFGEWILTPDNLHQAYERSTARIKNRWIESVHQQMEAERTVRKMLGEPEVWQSIHSSSQTLREAKSLLDTLANSELDTKLSTAKTDFLKLCDELSNFLEGFYEALCTDGFHGVQQLCDEAPIDIPKQKIRLLKILRNRNHPLALEVTNVVDDIHIALEAIREIRETVTTRMVAILANAGDGKTHLAISLARKTTYRPHGILWHAKDLIKGQTLNNFAEKICFGGKPCPSIEALLGALNSAGMRCKHKIPIVIDGLNETEDPRLWKPILNELDELLKSYNYVMVICTLRPGEDNQFHKEERYNDLPFNDNDSNLNTKEAFAGMALPEDIEKIPLEGFYDIKEAATAYFHHYNIQFDDIEQIEETPFLQSPLHLRLFCDTLNPQGNNQHPVTLPSLPTSFISLFKKYVDSIVERVLELYPTIQRHDKVVRAIKSFANLLWQQNARSIDEEKFRDQISDNGEYTDSLTSLLIQAGLIIRNPSWIDESKFELAPSFDMLGGFLIADSGIDKDVNSEQFSTRFIGEDAHPLANDILKNLVDLYPKNYKRQLWQCIHTDLKPAALHLTLFQDPKFLNEETLNEHRNMFKKPKNPNTFFNALWHLRTVPKHPLNVDFLDGILCNLSMTERDLLWTEWLRNGRRYDYDQPSRKFFKDLDVAENKWNHSNYELTESDVLNAKALKWLLTSTNHSLRNGATKVLHQFGMKDPQSLFEETTKSLAINDIYVSERMLAASYGVALKLCLNAKENTDILTGSFKKFTHELYNKIFANNALYASTHQYYRDFASKLILLGHQYADLQLDQAALANIQAPYDVSRLDNWEEFKLCDEHGQEREEYSYKKHSPFHMDFENYTIGQLVIDRGNYDFKHSEYKSVRSKLLWRIQNLGWSQEAFEAVDKNIAKNDYGRIEDNRLKCDRYGKKYAWIAFHEMAGLRRSQGKLRDKEGDNWYDDWRTGDLNIDPTFLDEPFKNSSDYNENFILNPSISTQEWIQNEELPDFSAICIRQELNGEAGSWRLLDGYISKENKQLDREYFYAVQTFIVSKDRASKLKKKLQNYDFTAHVLPEAITYDDLFWYEYSLLPNMHIQVPEEFLRIATSYQEVQRKIPVFHKTFKDAAAFSLSMTEELQVIKEPQYDDFPVDLPSSRIKYNLGTFHSEYSFKVISLPLIRDLKLKQKLGSCNFYSADGDLATYYINDGKYSRNKTDMLYIKTDILNEYLNQHNLEILTCVWGEKSYYKTGASWSEKYSPNYQKFYKLLDLK